MSKEKIKNLLTSPKMFWLTGLLALMWIVLRSGTNPKRLAYPCQQASFPFASLWVLTYVPLFERVVNYIKQKSKYWIVFLILIISVTVVKLGFKYKNKFKLNSAVAELKALNSESPVSDIFVYNNIPDSEGSLAAGDNSVPDSYLSDPAIDSLVYIMSTSRTPFFRTTDKPYGIIGKSDVVLIKANFQWRHRLGTNTDRIKGVIWQILNHPEGFAGEVLVVDNQESQIWPTEWLGGFNDNSNNSDDTEQSIVDVINTFKAKAYPVDMIIFDSLNNDVVSEYVDGDLNDGYIFNPATLTSYPKFESPKGNYVSFSKGIWDDNAKIYDSEKLTIINFPVLKAHGMAGATIALKNYIGVMNTTKHDEWFGGWVDDTFHPLYCFSEYALVAKELAIAWPDLNIIDATWVATESNYNFNYGAVNQKTILASTDPVAASWYAAKYILTPNAAFKERTNPDLTGQGADAYSTILGYWFDYLNDSTDFTVTKTESEITVYSIDNIPETNALNEVDLNSVVSVFPNPFHEKVTLSSPNNIVDDLNLHVYNLSGQCVFNKRIKKGNSYTEINLGFLAKGEYILQLISGKNFLKKKIVKI